MSSTAMRRFWTMVAHDHSQTWNSADPARALGVREPTVGRHLDLLTDALVLRQLRPWHANLRKRQVKSPRSASATAASSTSSSASRITPRS
ncbi:MAG: hypothetical protein KJ067_16165 [Vicinamibacteria bacterium]|nr:hypothetical protein [Vicinamibacteria bacterium]